jgi:hypothetical protein
MVEMVVQIQAPITGLTATNDSPTPLGRPTTFTATVTAGSNLIYTWDFGDTYTATGQVVTHTYAEPGVYTATVTATNLVSNATTTTTVVVEQWSLYLPIIRRPPAVTGQSYQTGHLAEGMILTALGIVWPLRRASGLGRAAYWRPEKTGGKLIYGYKLSSFSGK